MIRNLFCISLLLVASFVVMAQTEPTDADIIKMQQVNGSAATADVLAFQVIAEAQEKWNLKVNAGTNYAIPSGIFRSYTSVEAYRNNKTRYPGFTLGTSMSYSVLPWLAVESGLNFERIRTGYYAYYSNIPVSDIQPEIGDQVTYDSRMVKEHYTKDYLNVPLLIALKTSSSFGFFGGIGYRFALSKETGFDNQVEWNELIYTGGFL